MNNEDLVLGECSKFNSVRDLVGAAMVAPHELTHEDIRRLGAMAAARSEACRAWSKAKPGTDVVVMSLGGNPLLWTMPHKSDEEMAAAMGLAMLAYNVLLTEAACREGEE